MTNQELHHIQEAIAVARSAQLSGAYQKAAQRHGRQQACTEIAVKIAKLLPKEQQQEFLKGCYSLEKPTEA